MSFVSQLLGGGGGSGGMNYQAQGANLSQPTNATQATTAYDQTQQGIQAQQGLLGALQGANGIGNQSSVYNQLGQVANGQGPNPAQNMLNQSTGQNVSNQAALAAGVRGSNQNAGLVARQAANAGMNAQQQAIGQGATLQSQQSLNALGQQGTIAGQQVGNQIAATQGLNSAAQGQQANLLGAIQGQNTANVQMQGNQNTANASIANTVAQGQQNLLGGGLQAVGMNALGAALLNQGGEVHKYHEGGDVYESKVLNRMFGKCQGGAMDYRSGGDVPGRAAVSGNSPSNDTVPAMLSPGEYVIKRTDMHRPEVKKLISALEKGKQ